MKAVSSRIKCDGVPAKLAPVKLRAALLLVRTPTRSSRFAQEARVSRRWRVANGGSLVVGEVVVEEQTGQHFADDRPLR